MNFNLFLSRKVQVQSFFPRKNDTTETTITAPKIDGINAITARLGPHAPKRDCQTDEPTKPAMIFAIIPMDSPFLVIPPALRHISPHTIIHQIIIS